MTETVAPTPTVRSLREWLTRNPVALKELRGRMRGARAFIVLAVYLLLMSGFITLMYTIYVSANNSVTGGQDRQILGKYVFGGVVGIELLLVCFITPAFTVGAISGERERQTYDLLKTTLLPERSLIFGKLISALAYVFLLLLAALPLQSLAFLLGGVAPEEVLIATVLLMVTAFLFSAAGVFFSSLMRRTLGATIMTYAFVLLMTLGLPILLFPLALFASLFSTSNPPIEVIVVLVYVFLILVATNPVATMIGTEVLLVTENTIFYHTLPVPTPQGNNINLPFISPWLPYTAFALGLGAALILLSILSLKRTER